MKITISLIIVGCLVTAIHGRCSWPKSLRDLAKASKEAGRSICKAVKTIEFSTIPVNSNSVSGKVTNLKVKKVRCPNVKALLLQRYLLKLVISGLALDFSGKWEAKKGRRKMKGRITAKVSQVSANVVLRFRGKTPIVASCRAKIGRVRVGFSSKKPQDVNLFKRTVEREIRRTDVCSKVRVLVRREGLNFLC